MRRSEDYAEFCEWMKKSRKDSSIPEPEKFKNKRSDGAPPPVVLGFMRWNDIHSFPFEEWWKFIKKRLEYTIRNKGGWPQPVEDYSESIKRDFFLVNAFFHDSEGREPSLQEFQDDLIRHMKRFPERIHLAINLGSHEKIESFMKGIAKVIRQKAKRPDVEGIRRSGNRWLIPTGRIRFEELERYLRIYDLRKQGRSYREIAADPKVYPKKEFDEDLRNVLLKEKGKAIRIIRNTEYGIFPGTY